MTALLTLLPIFGYSTFFYIYLNKRSSVSIFFSITFIITILFIFGMLELLEYGSYSLFYLGIFLFIYTIYKHYLKVVTFITSIPTIIFTVSSIIYLFMMQDAQFFFWDEYSHWGAFIKEMYYFNSFYSIPSVASHLNYPPGISTWDYFIVSNTSFTEGNIYFGYFLLLFSSTLMMYEKFHFKDIHWVAIILAIQTIIFAGFGHWFSCIYVDHIIGAMFAGLVLSYLVDSFTKKELFLFLFPLISIVLVKEIGLFFGLSFLGLVFLHRLMKSKLENNNTLFFNIKLHTKTIFILFVLFISMVLVLKLWGFRQEINGVAKEHQTISGIAKSIFSDKKVLDEKTEEEVKKRFWEVVNNQQLHKEKISLNYNEFSYGLMQKYEKEIKLSTTGSMLFFILISIVTLLIYKEKEKRIEIALINSYILFVTIVYLFILYFSFLVAFGNGALRIPSYVRYMNMATLPMFMIGFSLMLPLLKSKYDEQKSYNFNSRIFISALLTISIFGYIVQPYINPMYSQLSNGFRKNIDTASVNILSKVPPKSKLFAIFPVKNNGSLNNILKYSLIPAITTVSKIDFEKKTFQEMLKIYSKYDYVWFVTLNQTLVEKNRNILRAKDKKNAYTLYKIEVTGNKVNFIPVI